MEKLQGDVWLRKSKFVPGLWWALLVKLKKNLLSFPQLQFNLSLFKFFLLSLLRQIIFLEMPGCQRGQLCQVLGAQTRKQKQTRTYSHRAQTRTYYVRIIGRWQGSNSKTFCSWHLSFLRRKYMAFPRC